VDRVDVGAFLTVHLDVDEQGVHPFGGPEVLEGLARHHMAPVAGGVADGDQDGHVAAACLGQGLLAPRPPLHRVVGVLQQVRAGRLAQSVGHTPNCAGRPDLGPRNGPGRVGHTLQRDVPLVCSSESVEVAGTSLPVSFGRSPVSVSLSATSLPAVSCSWVSCSWGPSSWAAFSASLCSARGVSLLVMLRMRKYRTRAIPKITRKPSTPGVTRLVFNSVRSAHTI